MNVAEKLLGAAITPDWEDTVTSLLRPNRNRLDAILLRLVFQTAIYVLWKERNSRRHGGVSAPVDTTTKAIGNQVKNLISSMKYMGNHKLRGLLSVSSMRLLITGQAIDGYSEQDDEIIFLADSCFKFCVESLMRKSNSGYIIDELIILWILNSCLYRQKYEDKVVSMMDHKGAVNCQHSLRTSRCIRSGKSTWGIA
ncbi:hypothetical protein F2Q70_00016886 [Brassica cretica]|uniref:Uncharacterized protein n=1 Tax=Brassica cretica TaxID=69181 RepID=A0A8S9L2Q2_BRACR|nr:hypothetical protein F2Q70_00016886 [Brassica cretica]KAF2600361.1 hypothetical protein F2Q68_00009854 [Brassica cretica]